MSGVNKVILIGNLGSDPEMRAMSNGNHVTNLSLATSSSWRDKISGEQKERTEWHKVVLFNQLAEIANEHLKKGSKIFVEGELRPQEWEREGQKHHTTQVSAYQMQMLDSKQRGADDFDDEMPF